MGRALPWIGYTRLALEEILDAELDRDMRSMARAAATGTARAIWSEPVWVEITPMRAGRAAAPRPEPAMMMPACEAEGRRAMMIAKVAGKTKPCR